MPPGQHASPRPAATSRCRGFVTPREACHPPRHGAAARRRRGSAILEFALVLPPLLMMVLLCIDFGRIAYYYIAVTNVARWRGLRQRERLPAARHPDGVPDEPEPGHGAIQLEEPRRGAGTADPP